MQKGTLYLLPNLLEDQLDWQASLPKSVEEAVMDLDGIIAESEKAARRYLLRFIDREKLQTIAIQLLNEHTDSNQLKPLLKPIQNGEKWGILSDAGLPCIADPGSHLVYLAQQCSNISVRSFAGPSSLLLGLQLSGLTAQRFAFHGYLPRKEPELKKALESLEKRSQHEKATQIWIEAPYRSLKMASFAINTLHPSTLFCIAQSLDSPDQCVRTQTIGTWRKSPIDLGKVPAVFFLYR